MAVQAKPLREERLWRYLLPNIITALSMLCGMAAIFASIEHRFDDAGWWIMYAVLSDKLDGVVARRVRGTSELGMQLDSLADFLNFGVVPPVLIFSSLGRIPSMPFSSDVGRVILFAACVTWLLGAVFRLARFNVSTEESPSGIFFGIPTTLAAGAIATLFLTLLKYTPDGHPMATEAFGGAKLFPWLVTPDVLWRYFPLTLFAGGFAMGSDLRIPKLDKMPSRWFTLFIFVNVFFGYLFSATRLFPEYLVFLPALWLIIFVTWGLFSEHARSLKAPPIFPRITPEPDEETEDRSTS